MIKKLDKLVIKAFLGPFAATFFITLFVLLMQFFWLWVDDFVGKGISTNIIFKFIWYQSAVLVTLALPLAILLSSLMTFGNLGESFELVAIKSSGISLLRFMRPLFIVAILLSGVAFLFSNYMIPVANLKSRTLLTNIVNSQPAFDLQEGVFYDKIPNYAIKIGKKEPNDTVIRDVIVYEQGGSLQDNFLIAKSGVMRLSDSNKRILEFILKDGWRYEERGDRYGSLRTDYIRVGFKEYKKEFDLSALGFQSLTNDSANMNNEKMLSMRQLNKAIDSFRIENRNIDREIEKTTFSVLPFTAFFDTTKNLELPVDTSTAIKKAKRFEDLLPDSVKQAVHDGTVGLITSLKNNVEANQVNSKEREKRLRRHKVEWHHKIVLALACLVLFLIGAPLGSIIRKGGLGMPLIFAIVFFMVFYFSTTVGEKLANEGTLSPFTGMWLATFVLVPVGVFLTYKAMRDSQLFNKESYRRFARTVGSFIRNPFRGA
ncbi:MAG TPA: LptF/LptG family permease [Chitinophagaceae bacterium]|nr:LptF/LptG family permease [Chitinophagaceae bacterium]